MEIGGKVALVTGGGNGIGRSIALSLAAEGARIVIVDLDEAGADAVAAEIAAAGGEALAVVGDVADDATFPMLRDRIVDRFGGLDILVNNAGQLVSGFVEDVPLSEWRRILDVNFLSMVRSVQTLLPLIEARGRGHIVNVASSIALYCYAVEGIAYAASKGAVLSFTEGLAVYLRPKAIGVTCLCPGPVATTIMSRARIFTPGATLYGAGEQFRTRAADEVGPMVVDAIRANRFLLTTDPGFSPVLIEHATDTDAFVRALADSPQVVYQLPLDIKPPVDV